MRLLYSILFISLTINVLAQKKIERSAPAKWINNINYTNEDLYDDNSGYQFLLLDFQDNFMEQSSFRHFVIKLSNSNGIQSNSDISVVFDPSYQKLYFHKITIIRNGTIIDKLNLNDFQVIQRESSMERALYDGSLTAVLNLTDVREQDIIEYSYTITGYNPIYRGNISNTFYHQYSNPVTRIYNRLITKPNTIFNYKLYNESEEPQIKGNSERKEYIWDIEALNFKLYDSNVPSWSEIHKKVTFTNIPDWNTVIKWALPLYAYNKEKIENISITIKHSNDKKEAACEFIRFTQNHIRYLGFEDGINAFKPNQPEKVFDQRYGDCKDKSLLLVSLLRNINIDAYPLLVNTYLGDEILTELPSINAFNHCIVCFRMDGKNYFVDPTISDQGGDIDHIPMPEYKYGLLIKDGEQGLIPIVPAEKPMLRINETLTLDSINGNANFSISTLYTGLKADAIRAYFNSNARDIIKKEYTDFYRNLYPRIETASSIHIFENDSTGADKLRVDENYTVKKIWEDATSGNKIYCEIYPLVLETYLDYYKSENREAPYYLGEPITFQQTSKVIMPEEWSSDDYEISIDGPAFMYHNKITCSGKEITVIHNFDLLKSSIPGDSIETFLSKIDDVKNELHYYLTYNPDRAKYNISWISVLLALISTIATIILSIFIYKKFNPISRMPDTNKAIGGWMVLPLIGLCFTPLIISSQVFTEDFFNHNTWVSVSRGETSVSISFLIVLGGELLYNFFLLSFSVFLIILFFRKRTSLPILISIFYTINLVGATADYTATRMVLADFLTDANATDSIQAITRAVFAAIIWIPYFNMSERVKATFCKTYTTVVEPVDN